MNECSNAALLPSSLIVHAAL